MHSTQAHVRSPFSRQFTHSTKTDSTERDNAIENGSSKNIDTQGWIDPFLSLLGIFAVSSGRLMSALEPEMKREKLGTVREGGILVAFC